jgi:hypothetical protein
MRRRPIRRRTAERAIELAFVAPQVIALRSLQMLAASNEPTARDYREWTLMGTEKAAAFGRSIAAMNAEWVRAALELPLALTREWSKWWLASWTAVSFAPRRHGGSGIERHWQRTLDRAFAAGLAPVHAAAVKNLRRLARSKRG